MASTSSVEDFIEEFNRSYEQAHKNYEDNFWATKMNLNGASGEKLTDSKDFLDSFLGNSKMLQKVRDMLQTDLIDEHRKVLGIFEKTFSCYILENPDAASIKKDIGRLEADLANSRNHMDLGYLEPVTNMFTKYSSVQLRNQMRTSDDQSIRLSCYKGLRTIGPFVSTKFCEIVKLRNIFAKSLGYECFYDMKVSQAEGFNKRTLFNILEDLESKTRPIMQSAVDLLAKEKGSDAILPYNLSYTLSGDVSKLKDPFFPFENAVDVWARSFAALGISYRGSTMRLDLCDRPGKYSNGFCHWPQPAWQSKDGWVSQKPALSYGNKDSVKLL